MDIGVREFVLFVTAALFLLEALVDNQRPGSWGFNIKRLTIRPGWLAFAGWAVMAALAERGN
jgi:hypothetical protein